jgi:hypothetical protein
MHLLVAAQSGWGKSYFTQSLIERNVGDYRTVVVLDYADEYRGIPEEGMAKWHIGGPVERRWSASEWSAFIDQNPKVVIARHDQLGAEDWRELCAAVARSLRGRAGDVLIVVDEAHFVTPQSEGYPKVLQELATTGRGERISFVPVSQRLSEMDKTVVTQMQSRLLGGFDSDNINRVADAIDGYPAALHNPLADPSPSTVPEALLPDGRERPTSVQLHQDDAGMIVGSEWIYSDNSGERRRIDTRGLDMTATHYSPQGAQINIPG